MFNKCNDKNTCCILSFRDIVILPFEGQQAASSNQRGDTAQKAQGNGAVNRKGANAARPAQRKTFQQPTGKLSTNNIGIKETLNPTIRKSKNQQSQLNSEAKEPFTFEELQHVWKAYTLNIKRERKDNLHSALDFGYKNMQVSTEHNITITLKSTAQGKKIEEDKVELLGYLRSELKNYSITLDYKINAKKSKKRLDSKGLFEKMAEENTSLNKFRKLFNLEIEF